MEEGDCICQTRLGKPRNWGPWLGGALDKSKKPLSHGFVQGGGKVMVRPHKNASRELTRVGTWES